MLRFLYTAPDGTRTVDPSDAVLNDLLFDTPWTDWDSSDNAESCLEVIVHAGTPSDDEVATDFNISRDDPCLVIKQPDPGLFFITFMHNGAQYVPYNGASVTGYTLSHSGGNPCYIPLACTTDVDATKQIVAGFRSNLTRDASVNWVGWYDLDIPEDWY